MITEESYTTLQRALAGAYTLDGEIGRGGMGVVYRARDDRHDRTVAIKVLRSEIASGIGAARFAREVRIEARLQHPNVVPVHEWGERDGLVYCVMPFIDGESLRSRLRRERQLPVSDAIRIAREVASALAYAHAQGVVHRDVKPENVLLSSGHAMLTDFGVARLAGVGISENLTDPGLAVGTVSYMSPEQASGDSAVDARSDIYSLACVLYEMLSGDPPFGGSTPQAIIARHLHDLPPPVSVVRPSVPPNVIAALERALQKVPADRFQTAGAFADALEVTGTTPLPQRGAGEEASQPRAPAQSARRWIAVAVLVAAAAIAPFVWPRGAPELDDRKIVVFPLVHASDSGLSPGDGWGVSIAIGASLEHADPLRVIDGWSRLSAETRNDMRLLSAATANRLTRERGARYFVDGALTRRGDSAAVVLRLYDALGDSLIAQESAAGAANVPMPTLGLRAVTKLLPRLLDPTRRIDVVDLTSRAPSAVALWIQGERAYRLSRFGTALDLFRRAVREDSALAIAAVRGAQAASWESRLEEAEVLVGLALSRPQMLSRRQAEFATGLRFYLEGNADSALSTLARVVADDPDGAEPAMALAEVHHHLMAGPTTPPDSAAAVWLGEAVRRDSAFTPPLLHLAEIALRRGDIERGDSLIGRLRGQGGEPALVRPLELMQACLRGSASWSPIANVDPEGALSAAKEMSAHLAQPRCAEDGFRAVLRSPAADAGVRWSALLGLQGLLVATRRDVDLRALLDSTVAAGTTQALSLYILDAMAGADRSLMAPKAEEAARFAAGAYGNAYERASPQTRWVLGLWHGLARDTARLARMQATSAEVAAGGGRRERLFAQAMNAQLLLARGDTDRAIGVLRGMSPSARRDSLTYELFEPLAVERATLARLLLARGADDEALRVASTLDHAQPAIYLAFLPLSLDIRARAAARLDRGSEAEQYRARLRALESVREAPR